MTRSEPPRPPNPDDAGGPAAADDDGAGGPHPAVTRLMHAAGGGDAAAAAALLPLVYQELRRLARARLRRNGTGQTLQPTALVHDAYLRLVGGADDGEAGGQQRWAGRGHFFAAAAEAMRHILVDNARRRLAARHGGGRRRVELDEQRLDAPQPPEDLLALDEALGQLAELHPRKAELVKLRYFAGLTIAEAAEALGIGTSTADRHWAFARAWLHRQIRCDRDQVGDGTRDYLSDEGRR